MTQLRWSLCVNLFDRPSVFCFYHGGILSLWYCESWYSVRYSVMMTTYLLWTTLGFWLIILDSCRLLDPDLESSGSLFVGSYILQLILHLPSQMSVHIRELVAAVVRRLQSCEITGLKSSLIVILARLVMPCSVSFILRAFFYWVQMRIFFFLLI